MTVNIPAELQPYITIVPSAYFSETAPMVFDFSNINVATIQDGFKADYYYDINVSASLPAQYKGQVHSFNITLHPEYFDVLPGGSNDPTPAGTHDYTLAIPPLVLAIPNDAGEVFYTSGYAHNLVWAHTINPIFTPTAVQFVNATTAIPPLSQIAANQADRVANLREYWQNLTSHQNDSCAFTYKDIGTQRIVYLDLSSKGDEFPFANPAGGEDIAFVDLLIYSNVSQVPYGWNTVFYTSVATFNDDVGKQKQADVVIPQQVRATGAWLQLQIESSLYNPAVGAPYDVNNLHFSDAGVAEILVIATNVGSDIAYNVNFTLYLGEGITVSNNITTKYALSGNNLTLFTGFFLPPGTPLSLYVPLNFSGLSAANSSATERLFVSQTYGSMDLTQVPGEDTVTQVLEQAVVVC
eukprot:Phypoly_transcript_07508.p1 GENE.Phypoly_transcript_07508~~Phypoly_transcript_07508.p1  ORF type:complete len:410 (+),score=104.82 Phypoly_transcript_07508:199-1428(+)